MDEEGIVHNKEVVDESPDNTPIRKREKENENENTPVKRKKEDYDVTPVQNDSNNGNNNDNNTEHDSQHSEDEDEKEQEQQQELPKKPKERIQAELGFLTGCRSVDTFAKLNRVEEGSYGVVFRAKDKQTGEVVALKKVKMDREKEGFPITALREIHILMAHKHPNVVDVKEIAIGSKLDSIFIVMEFLDHDLKDLMGEMKDDTRFLTSEVKCLMIQLLSGIAHLHENWIIHRDLKTSNLLYNNKGILKIADFGMAREYGSPLKPYTELVVTLWYRAPELLLGAKTYTPAVDMWSVGCIFAEMITKEPLISGRSELDQLDKMFKLLGSPNETIWPGLSELPNSQKINFQNQPYNHLRQKIPFITELCADLLSKLLTYDPAKRITAVEALKHPYFQESPRAKDPMFMPTWPSSHDGTKKRRKSSLDEEQMKERILMEAKADDDRFGRSYGSFGFQLRI